MIDPVVNQNGVNGQSREGRGNKVKRANNNPPPIGRGHVLTGCLTLLVLLMTLILPGFGFAEGENLLVNPGFEELDGEGLPVGWETDAYRMDEGYTIFKSVTEEGLPEGDKCAFIQNVAMNDARFSQTVQVEPESLYCFSGYIRAENVKEGLGANLSIEGLYRFSESVYDTDDFWQYVKWYGETGEDQTSVTLFARLGGYSGESRGKAWFDGLCLEKVDEAPGDIIADLWYKENTIAVYDDSDESDEAEENGNPAWPLLIIAVLAYTVIAVITVRKEENPVDLTKPDRRTPISLWLVFIAALALRVVISALTAGYSVDVNCFLSWGHTMTQAGPAGFYEATSFCDYPPAYTYILGLNSLVSSWLGGGTEVSRAVFRFIPSLCDLGACWLIYRFAMRHFPKADKRNTVIFCAVLAFNPAFIINSAAWGQMDSVLCLLLLMVAAYAMEGRWELSLPCYMLAVLVKPQALMLGFLGVLAAGMIWVKEKESRKKILIGLGGSALVAAAVIIPFSLRQTPGWLINQYAKALGSYPYATVNTANFYYPLGGNWNKIENSAHLAANLLLAVGVLGYGAAWTLRFRKENQKRMWIEQALICLFIIWFIFCAITSASWTFTGVGAMAFSFLVVLSLYIRKGDIHFLPYLGALLFILLYVFGIKMHERYIFPALFLLGLAWVVHRDPRILTVLLAMTAAEFLNEGIVLDNCIRLGSSQGHLNNDTTILADIISVINVAAAVYAVHVGMILGSREPEKPRRIRLFPDQKTDNRLHWKGKDTAILCGIIAIYSLVCFATLGSTKAPQNAWTSTDYEENVTLDLGEEIDGFTMLYFCRVSRYDFAVEVSSDGEDWQDETWAEMAQGQCWKWKYVTDSHEDSDGNRTFTGSRHWFDGRYVRITAHQIGLALCEVIFRDEDGNNLPAKVIGHENYTEESSLFSDPAALLDEQDTLEALPVYFPGASKDAEGEERPESAQPSWWNSTYFDEIYHARTAYEFLNQSVPYETTHPPLGKVLMSWGVAVFGMTPFGWRFAGALAGVAMLAGMYLLGKQLTKSSAAAALMCGLLALDCMHLTQTQIATIDSFPVLFILFSWFFMLRFTQTDIGAESRRRILTDLGLSGLFMGLGIASKWIGIYSGAGLAVLFFTHCFSYLRRERALASAQAKVVKSPWKRSEKGSAASAPESGSDSPLRRVFLICLWCLLFFVVVPLVIYLLSYIPYYAYKHHSGIGEFLKDVWNAQTGMYNYHSTPGLGMDHPFYSPWYEWPVIGKPMYYSTNQYAFIPGYSFSIFCIGNPVIWWTGIGAIALCAAAWLMNRGYCEVTPDLQGQNRIAGGTDNSLFFLLVGILAQYLPWMLVPRGTYIYHYFASVPFLIASLGLVFHGIRLRNRRAGLIAAVVFLVLAAAAFLVYFPYISGITSPYGWLDLGKGLLNVYYSK